MKGKMLEKVRKWKKREVRVKHGRKWEKWGGGGGVVKEEKRRKIVKLLNIITSVITMRICF